MDMVAFFFHLVLLLSLPTICISLIKRGIETDQHALLALKSHLSDPSVLLEKNWTTRVSVCNWSGVTCSSRHQRVAALNISFLGLQGSIPPEIGNLSFLNSLDLRGNNFRGNLPDEMVRLRRLRYINLNFNKLSGTVPSWFGFLPNLQYLYLSNNSFTNTLPLSLFNASKLVSVYILFNELQGNIPEEISNLGNLKTLAMQGNQFIGSLPRTLFNMSSLEVIALTSNLLTGNLPVNICSKLPKLRGVYLSENKLSGPIHSRFDNCSELQYLSLSSNDFSGTLPREIGNLTTLKIIALGTNYFTGEIPFVSGNLQNLEALGIEFCRLTGPVPKEIGNLEKLSLLYLNFNFLSGQIPSTLFNISSLRLISLGVNNLSGSLPPALGHMLPNLERLGIGANKLSGGIPDSLSNFTKLITLDLGSNQLTGSIPTSLGSLGDLDYFNLENNQLTSGSYREISFLSSLVNCRSLRVLRISSNPLKGTLPRTIANFSNSLALFMSSSCELVGNIPHEIGNLSGLLELDLGGNYMTGSLLVAFKGLEDLQGLNLAGNKIEGSIPHYFCNFKELTILELSENQLFGQVPECFGNITSLRNLYLDSNRLNSMLPASLGKLKDLLYLYIQSNSMSGNIPQELGNLKAAISIDLSDNIFSGNIPATIGGLQNLINLSLAHNELQGSIPESLGNMVNLELIDLSRNNLTGEIPKSTESLLYLKYFNVSFNHLQGKVPENGSFLNFMKEFFVSNDALCGGPPHLQLPPCPTNSPQGSRTKRLRLITYILLPTGLTIFALASIWFLVMKNRRKRSLAQGDLIPTLIMHERVSYYELQQATDNFSESNLLAKGGYGSVYKGVLRDGTSTAIKVFSTQLEGAFKSFDQECNLLTNLRHRNLVKIISSCSNPDFKALVLEYMPNGSLEKWLYSHNYFLNFLQRLDIMIDVASALDYLHHGCESPVVHCDLKPGNVLLDSEMTGHVSDFGISKLFRGGESMAQTKTLATIGYIAPEYGAKGIVSTRCDVYSFGILLMETFSRKKPTDEMFIEEWGMKEWIMDSLQNSKTKFMDDNLITLEERNSQRMIQCILCTMELALRCTIESAEQRIDIGDALEELKKIKILYLSK
ncbi:hypothetical protein ACH5RR_015291 [Cinchona calisaya]|uniref:non-specific serine/threonine protein kinase n=1 Tax=Cinchona calisaya TaxID=153742 RepID=A0ABD2ZVE5_9GENT